MKQIHRNAVVWGMISMLGLTTNLSAQDAEPGAELEGLIITPVPREAVKDSGSVRQLTFTDEFMQNQVNWPSISLLLAEMASTSDLDCIVVDRPLLNEATAGVACGGGEAVQTGPRGIEDLLPSFEPTIARIDRNALASSDVAATEGIAKMAERFAILAEEIADDADQEVLDAMALEGLDEEIKANIVAEKIREARRTRKQAEDVAKVAASARAKADAAREKQEEEQKKQQQEEEAKKQQQDSQPDTKPPADQPNPNDDSVVVPPECEEEVAESIGDLPSGVTDPSPEDAPAIPERYLACLPDSVLIDFDSFCQQDLVAQADPHSPGSLCLPEATINIPMITNQDLAIDPIPVGELQGPLSTLARFLDEHGANQ